VSWWVVKQEQAETIALRREAFLQIFNNGLYAAAVASNSQLAQDRVRSNNPSPQWQRPPSKNVRTNSYQFQTDANEERFTC